MYGPTEALRCWGRGAEGQIAQGSTWASEEQERYRGHRMCSNVPLFIYTVCCKRMPTIICKSVSEPCRGLRWFKFVTSENVGSKKSVGGSCLLDMSSDIGVLNM